MSQDQDISREFQKRRETTWRLAKPWVLFMIVGWIGILIVFSASGLSPDVSASLILLSFLILVVTIIRINFIIMRNYRCPACGKIPIVNGVRHGVMCNPEECPNCGAMLK
jgi:uncharacterized sodium:solute symporter family permease YidK